jgi:hypothetical protein
MAPSMNIMTDRDRKIVRIAFMETHPKYAEFFKPIHKGRFFACLGLCLLGLVAVLDLLIRLVFHLIREVLR